MSVDKEALIFAIAVLIILFILFPWIIKVGIFLHINELFKLFVVYANWVINI